MLPENNRKFYLQINLLIRNFSHYFANVKCALFSDVLYEYVLLSTVMQFKQDAREAMRVVFSVLTKRICMHKTKFLMNIFKYCLKIILNSMNL